MGSPATIAVIVPTLEEEDTIEGCLAAARRAGGELELELIVADGGSTDATVERARACGATVVRCPRGRWVQMNRGAAAARAEILLFCHADTRLPPDSLGMVRDVLADADVSGGCYRLRFDEEHPLLRFYAWFTRLRFWWAHYGDAAYFLRRSTFLALGGYAPLPLLEDADLQLRLRRQGRWAVLPAHALTSARRFREHGRVRQQLRNLRVVLLWRLGIAPRPESA